MTHNTECVFVHSCVGVNVIFRARTMPVQPDRAQPAIAEFGDSTEDTVSAQLHRYAGKKRCTEKHTHAPVQIAGEAIYVVFHLEVCV